MKASITASPTHCLRLTRGDESFRDINKLLRLDKTERVKIGVIVRVRECEVRSERV